VIPSHKVALKLYATGEIPADARFVETFHDWVRRGELNELMIDVVDYAHVHEGPSVFFVGHESDYAIDRDEGRPGLTYLRKRVANDDPATCLADAFRRTLDVAARLEREPRLEGLRFSTSDVRLRFLDRLRAPNADATLATFSEELSAFVARALGPGATFTRDPSDDRRPFTLRIRAPQDALVADVLARVTA
jgi:hypothetical protein